MSSTPRFTSHIAMVLMITLVTVNSTTTCIYKPSCEPGLIHKIQVITDIRELMKHIAANNSPQVRLGYACANNVTTDLDFAELDKPITFELCGDINYRPSIKASDLKILVTAREDDFALVKDTGDVFAKKDVSISLEGDKIDWYGQGLLRLENSTVHGNDIHIRNVQASRTVIRSTGNLTITDSEFGSTSDIHGERVSTKNTRLSNVTLEAGTVTLTNTTTSSVTISSRGDIVCSGATFKGTNSFLVDASFSAGSSHFTGGHFQLRSLSSLSTIHSCTMEDVYFTSSERVSITNSKLNRASIRSLRNSLVSSSSISSTMLRSGSNMTVDKSTFTSGSSALLATRRIVMVGLEMAQGTVSVAAPSVEWSNSTSSVSPDTAGDIVINTTYLVVQDSTITGGTFNVSATESPGRGTDVSVTRSDIHCVEVHLNLHQGVVASSNITAVETYMTQHRETRDGEKVLLKGARFHGERLTVDVPRTRLHLEDSALTLDHLVQLLSGEEVVVTNSVISVGRDDGGMPCSQGGVLGGSQRPGGEGERPGCLVSLKKTQLVSHSSCHVPFAIQDNASGSEHMRIAIEEVSFDTGAAAPALVVRNKFASLKMDDVDFGPYDLAYLELSDFDFTNQSSSPIWSNVVGHHKIECNDTDVSLFGLTSCMPCSVGGFARVNSTTCVPCEAGSYAPVGAHACTPCAKGSFSGNGHEYSCTLCPAGQYQDEEGMSSCKVCESDTTGELGLWTCGSGDGSASETTFELIGITLSAVLSLLTIARTIYACHRMKEMEEDDGDDDARYDDGGRENDDADDLDERTEQRKGSADVTTQDNWSSAFDGKSDMSELEAGLSARGMNVLRQPLLLPQSQASDGSTSSAIREEYDDYVSVVSGKW